MNRTVRAILLGALILVGLDTLAASSVRQRWLMATVGLVFAFLLFLQRKWLLQRNSRVHVLVALLASFLPIFALGLFDTGDRVRVVLAELIPTTIGWCVLLALALYTPEDDGSGDEVDWTVTPLRGALALAAVFAMLAVAHYIAVGNLAFVADEVVYLTQSRWMRPGQWTASMDPDLAPFFLMRQIGYLDGHFVGQYPAGWPMLLATFRMLGLEWWSSVILGTVSVALLYRLGARLHSRRAGVLAAFLMATSLYYVWIHSGYMSHASVMTCFLAGALCLLSGLDRKGWPRALYWFAAGVFLGLSVAIRPLTGVAAGMSIGLWMLGRTWKVDRPAVATLIGACLLGGAVPAALLFTYNAAVNGGPLVNGYDFIHQGLHSIGLGPTGFMTLDENLNRVPTAGVFTFAEAVQGTINRIPQINTTFFPIGFLMPTLVAALVAGYRLHWGIISVFMILPVAYFFFRNDDVRYFVELLPFMFLAVATMLVTIGRRRKGLALALVAMMVLSQVIIAVPTADANRPAAIRTWQRSDYGPTAPARRMAFASIDSLQREHGRILLFSREATPFDNQIDRLYIHNTPDFNGPVLVARDRRERNVELIREHPDRVPFLIIDNHRFTPATIVPIDRPE